MTCLAMNLRNILLQRLGLRTVGGGFLNIKNTFKMKNKVFRNHKRKTLNNQYNKYNFLEKSLLESLLITLHRA